MAPISGGSSGLGRGRKESGKLWDSNDEETSSEEDFNFIKQKLQQNDGQLDEETMKLLRGVVS